MTSGRADYHPDVALATKQDIMAALLALIQDKTDNLPEDPATVTTQALIINALAEVQAGTNILTSTEDNIIIDLLTQGAYTERRSTIENDNGVMDGVAPPAYNTAVTYKGKFYPRGCRGKIEQIQIYCKDAGADKITLRYSSHPGLGAIGEVTITPLATWAWRSAAIKEMWNYDSLFIWIHECEAGVDWGYDAVEPYDAHSSGDSGETWEDTAIRPFIRAVYSGQTLGDVPVSGLVNTIPIPSVSSARIFANEVLTTGEEYDVIDINGAGYTTLILARATAAADSHETWIYVYCDEQRAYAWPFSDLSVYGFTASSPGVSLLNYAEDGLCSAVITHRFEFKRRLRITARNTSGAPTIHIQLLPTFMR